jgi:phospholipase/carboxylesterase
MTNDHADLFHLVREPAPGGEGKAPLLLLLHGKGSNEEDLFALADEFDPRFCVVSARAPNMIGPRAWAWYHLRFVPGGSVAEAPEVEESRLALLGFIDDIVASHGLDPERIFLAGFSQGAIMGVAVALTRPRGIAGVVAMSGRFLHEIEARIAADGELEGLPLLVLHGTRDEVLPIAYGRELKERLSKLPVALEYHEYYMTHEITPESLGRACYWLSERLGRRA